MLQPASEEDIARPGQNIFCTRQAGPEENSSMLNLLGSRQHWDAQLLTKTRAPICTQTNSHCRKVYSKRQLKGRDVLLTQSKGS
eukprot:scaffold174386_cov17-Tisochrysis_lutea.AAC.1